mmetsp:Transcript_12933/g.16942  ORF Transcript_12933/g.16942 Transcript_12933/m.16942 type:complete len:191 (-) Transcript_12933:309-881(-)
MESSSTDESGTAAVAVDSYIKTNTGNFVSRKTEISEAKNVEIKGKSWIQENVVIRGDLAKIRMGRYCKISDGVVLEPAPIVGSDQHVPVSIGSHTMIGAGTKVHAAAVGSYCWIGPNVKLGPRAIIKDACVIEEGVVLGDDVVIPPFTRVSKRGKSLLQMMDLPPATIQLLQEESMETYQEFLAAQRRLQ